MAIDTQNAAIAGMRPPVQIAKAATGTLVAGRPVSLWALAGAPGPGSYNGTLNGVVLSSSAGLVAGQIPHYDPASGDAHIARMVVSANQAGRLLVLDRLWHNGGISATSTAAQAITSPAWPTRGPTSGINDAPSALGHNVMIAAEVSAAMGAGTPTLTLGYTNSEGTAARTATNTLATAATAPAGTTYFFGLQAGDVGVRSVQSYTQSATWTSGTINLVAYRILADIDIPSNGPGVIDPLTGGLPQVYNGTVPWMVFIPNTTTATNVTGSYLETQG